MDAGACDCCGEARATVYCRADSARLCLSCDRHVHGANALSLRHLRTLLCDGCNLRPAAVQCPVENVALCQSCDWDSHGSSPVGSQHRRHAFDCFSGCPSAAELGGLWGCDLVSVESRTTIAPRNLEGFNNGGGSCGDKLGASEASEVSAGPIATAETWGSCHTAQRPESCVPDGRTSPGEVATFASMCGAGPPLLAKGHMPTGPVLMEKGGGQGSKQQLREEVVQQLHKLRVLDPQVQMQEARMVLHLSKKPPSSLQSSSLQPSRAFVPQLLEQERQPKACMNQPLSNQQQAANLQNSRSSDFQIFTTLMQGGNAFWCSSSCQLWGQNMQDLGICEGEEGDPCEGFNAVDVDLSFDSYEDIFSRTQGLSSSSFDDIEAAGCTSIGQDTVRENQHEHLQSIPESELLDLTTGAIYVGPQKQGYEGKLAWSTSISRDE